jgi:hypothetical protein
MLSAPRRKHRVPDHRQSTSPHRRHRCPYDRRQWRRARRHPVCPRHGGQRPSEHRSHCPRNPELDQGDTCSGCFGGAGDGESHIRDVGHHQPVRNRVGASARLVAPGADRTLVPGLQLRGARSGRRRRDPSGRSPLLLEQGAPPREPTLARGTSASTSPSPSRAACRERRTYPLACLSSPPR